MSKRELNEIELTEVSAGTALGANQSQGPGYTLSFQKGNLVGQLGEVRSEESDRKSGAQVKS